MENNTDQNTQETPAATESQTTSPAADPVAEAQQKYLYLYAEFENYKKRAFKERQDIVKYAFEGAASDLIPVLDNFERALQFAKPEGDPQLVEGLKMVMTQFKSGLERQGVQEIPTENRPFNPEFHEAVSQAPSDKPQGTIIQTHQKGYTLHGRLIRPARVVVSSGPAS